MLVSAVACSSGKSSRDGALVDAGGTTGANAPASGGRSGLGGRPHVIGDPPFWHCGNGSHDEPEECDDGNVVGGDGCSPACELEANFSCPSEGPCTFVVQCGDSVVSVSREACDDGNAASGDGCSSSCSREPGWSCPAVGVPCRPICGDSVVLPLEQCDDGNAVSGDGCSAACRIEHAQCLVGNGGATGTGGAAGESGNSEGGAAGGMDCTAPVCGDATVDAPEECDDGFARNDGHYGGCTADCRYAPFCGDGVVTADQEECDGWSAAPTSHAPGCSACRRTPYCGDGVIQPDVGEQCDEGSRNGVSFCTAACALNSR